MNDCDITIFICIQGSCTGTSHIVCDLISATIVMIGFKVGPDLTRHTSTEFWLSKTSTTLLSMSMTTDAVIEMQCTRMCICLWNTMLFKFYTHNYAQVTHEDMHKWHMYTHLQTDLSLMYMHNNNYRTLINYNTGKYTLFKGVSALWLRDVEGQSHDPLQDLYQSHQQYYTQWICYIALYSILSRYVHCNQVTCVYP